MSDSHQTSTTADINYTQYINDTVLGIGLLTNHTNHRMHQLSLHLKHTDTTTTDTHGHIVLRFYGIEDVRLNYSDTTSLTTITSIIEHTRSQWSSACYNDDKEQHLRHFSIKLQTYHYSFIDVLCKDFEALVYSKQISEGENGSTY